MWTSCRGGGSLQAIGKGLAALLRTPWATSTDVVALVELLQTGVSRPDAALSLELYDDVAWEQAGTATELLQVKHHIGQHRSLTSTAADVWRTLKVWMDEASPSDPTGPALALVTTETAAEERLSQPCARTAAMRLRPSACWSTSPVRPPPS